jgi:hypothetical protein
MSVDARERTMENLAVASAIGFIAIVVAAASLFSESAVAEGERSAIAALGGGTVRAEAARFDDPSFSRIYSISGGAAPYGAVLSLPGKRGPALRAALLFREDGAVSVARALGPEPAPAWLDQIAGIGASSPAPSSKAEAPDPDAVSGATESYLSGAEAAGRAAAAAASFADDAASSRGGGR